MYTNKRNCIYSVSIEVLFMNIRVAHSELNEPPRVKVSSLIYEAIAVVAVGVVLALLLH